jgi:hypothetical protein
MSVTDETPEETPASPSTDELLAELLAGQKQHRAEVAELRKELEAAKQQPRQVPVNNQSAEELHAARMERIGQFDYYCPGCGNLSPYLHECTGRPEAPHPPILFVSTDELKGDDTSEHTAAPNTDKVYVTQ